MHNPGGFPQAAQGLTASPQITEAVKPFLYKTGRASDDTLIATDLTLNFSIKSILKDHPHP